MNSVYSEDFFIYVPSLHDVETLVHTAFKAWVKIALDEQVIVYAHSWSEGERAQVNGEVDDSTPSDKNI